MDYDNGDQLTKRQIEVLSIFNKFRINNKHKTSAYTNPIDYPGYTWTPIVNLDEVHDRIDFIYHNNSITVESVFLIGPDNFSDIVMPNYESDHRALLVNFKL